MLLRISWSKIMRGVRRLELFDHEKRYVLGLGYLHIIQTEIFPVRPPPYIKCPYQTLGLGLIVCDAVVRENFAREN